MTKPSPCSWCGRDDLDQQWWHETSQYVDSIRIVHTYCPSCWSLRKEQGIRLEWKDRIKANFEEPLATQIINILDEIG